MLRLTQLDFNVSSGIAHITLSGEPLDARAARELVATAQEIEEDRTIRAVLLTSAGQDFCPGPADDLDRLAVSPDPAAALARLTMPVVAVVSGACRSVGFEIILAADIVVCSENARFSLPDISAGILPCWGGTQRLSRAVSPTLATAMMLLGDELTGSRAAHSGLAYRVCPDRGAARLAADEIVATVVSLGPLAMSLGKEAVHRGSELPLRDGLRLEGDLNHLLAATEDRAEGLQAFFEKRPPDFTGR